MVHNGVIENYQSLKVQMEAEGHEFESQTDSEVLAHLVGKCFDSSPETDDRKCLVGAVREALTIVSGTYGIVVTHADVPKFLVGARLGSPLVVGLGKGEKFLASDVGAIVAHTSDAIYMRDRELVYMSDDDFSIENIDGDAAEVTMPIFFAEEMKSQAPSNSTARESNRTGQMS